MQRWGHESGIQRYRYYDCHRTFNALTGSPLAELTQDRARLKRELDSIGQIQVAS